MDGVTAWSGGGPGLGGPSRLAARMQPQRGSSGSRWRASRPVDRPQQASWEPLRPSRPGPPALSDFVLAPATVAAVAEVGGRFSRPARAPGQRKAKRYEQAAARSQFLRRAAITGVATIGLAVAVTTGPAAWQALFPGDTHPAERPAALTNVPAPVISASTPVAQASAAAGARSPLRLPLVAADGLPSSPTSPARTQSTTNSSPGTPAPRGNDDVLGQSTGGGSLIQPVVEQSPTPTSPATATPTPSPAGTPTPSATPSAAATPTEAVVAKSAGDIDEWLEAAGWPVNLRPQAKKVAWCESSYRPTALNGNARGLFQIWQDMRPGGWGWFSIFGYDPNQWADPVVNARVALLVYLYDLQHGNRAWSQWTCKP